MALNSDGAHLARLRDHYAAHGAMPPSYAGIGEVVGFRTKNAAVKLARRLTDSGYLKAAPGGKLAPTPRFFELPVAQAKVPAGLPTAIEAEAAAELVTLDSLLVAKPSKTVLVRVKGDSMRDAGILDGDLAVVERSESARPGDFVVALVDDEFTLKEFRYEGRQPVLVPHNPTHNPIRPGALEIFGKVRGIVRHYAHTPSLDGRLTEGARK
jgi:SOS regulatory protein LexA